MCHRADEGGSGPRLRMSACVHRDLVQRAAKHGAAKRSTYQPEQILAAGHAALLQVGSPSLAIYIF